MLKQVRILENYIDSFEDLRASMLEFNPTLIEAHFLHSFISRLHKEIRHGVTMFKPQTLEVAYELAESEERKIEALRRQNSYSKGSNLSTKPIQNRSIGKHTPEPKFLTDQKGNKPTADFKKGQCYRCGDKWLLATNARVELYTTLRGELPEEDTDEEEIVAEPSLEEGDTEKEVTLNAITCHFPPSTLKLATTINDEEIQVLIDLGSTNSFIDPKVLQRLRIKAARTYLLIVIVANDNKTVSIDEVSQFSWEIQAHRFKADLRELKLADCQMILGVDWLRDLSPVTFDFRGLTC